MSNSEPSSDHLHSNEPSGGSSNFDPSSSVKRETNSSNGKKPPWVKIFRIFVAIIVAAAIVYTVVKASNQLEESKFDIRKVSLQWWFAALIAYVLTMLMSCIFWHRVLLAIKQKPAFINSLLAFFASQLGKYVPGKAMVVVIRTDMIRGDDVRTAPAAASVFVETLTWMFVGAVMGSLLLVFCFPDQFVLQIAGAAIAVLAGVLTWPPIFRRIATRASKISEKRADKLFVGLNLRLMAFGWVSIAIGWCFNGLSLWFVLKGIPGADVVASDFPLTLACVTLASVTGFVSLLPGGLGVRELVMIPLLGARFGTVNAVVAAIVIRLVWMIAEIATSGVIYIWRRVR